MEAVFVDAAGGLVAVLAAMGVRRWAVRGGWDGVPVTIAIVAGTVAILELVRHLW